MPSFLAELKRRRVVRVALVYGAVAFAVVQAADVFVPALGLPGWSLTAVALLAILGFPVAVVLAWAYDIHPEAGSPSVAPGPGSGGEGGVSSASAAAPPPDAERGGSGSELSGGTAPLESPPRPHTRPQPAWLGVRTLVAVAALVLLGLAFGAGWLIPSGAASLSGSAESDAPPSSPWTTRVPLAIDATSLRGPPSLSTDGRRLAWTAPDGIHLRSLDQIVDRVVPGTGGASVAFFSPDGRDLGFILDGELHVTGLEGEADRVLLDSAVIGIPVWSEDGWIYAQSGASYALLRVRQDGDPVETLLEADSTRVFIPRTSISGGRWILGEVLDPTRVEATDAEDRPDPVIGVLDPVDGETRPLLDGRLPRYEPLTGHLVFLRGETLMAVAFDPDRAEVDGVPFVVADFDVGVASPGDDEIRLLVEGPANEEDPDVSSDGRWLAYESDASGSREVYVTPFGEVGRGQRISVAGGNNPLWSRSDRTLIFRNGQDELEQVRIGPGPELEVLERSVLFDVTGLTGRFHPAPGDSLFMAKDEFGPRADARVILVRNWARELAARAEAAKERSRARR